jgi:hypothetical protein
MKPVQFKVASLLLVVTHMGRADPPHDGKLPQIVMATLSPSTNTTAASPTVGLYTEAFRRLGYQLVVVHLPPARASAEADANRIDGELARGSHYGAAHPGLVRVEEPAYSITLAAFTVGPGLALSGWNGLRNKEYKVEYRFGIESARAGLAQIVPPVRLSSIPTTLQGLQKLAIGRTDVFIDFDVHVVPLLRTTSLANNARIYRAGTVQQVSLYAYMSAKNAALASQLAAVLKDLKRENKSAVPPVVTAGGTVRR